MSELLRRLQAVRLTAGMNRICLNVKKTSPFRCLYPSNEPNSAERRAVLTHTVSIYYKFRICHDFLGVTALLLTKHTFYVARDTGPASHAGVIRDLPAVHAPPRSFVDLIRYFGQQPANHPETSVTLRSETDGGRVSLLRSAARARRRSILRTISI
jgi:hypothetical protein